MPAEKDGGTGDEPIDSPIPSPRRSSSLVIGAALRLSSSSKPLSSRMLPLTGHDASGGLIEFTMPSQEQLLRLLIVW